MNTFFQIFLPFLYGRLSVSSPASYWQLQTHQRVLHIISNTWVINQQLSSSMQSAFTLFKAKAKHKLPYSIPGEPSSARGKREEPGAQRKGTVLVSFPRRRQHCSHRLRHRCSYGGGRGHPRTIQGSCKPPRMSDTFGGERPRMEDRHPSLVVQEP